jgi:hypothetical protein
MELLAVCIAPDKDLLMPALTSARSTESFLIVASTDLKGTEVIIDRIRNQLARHVDLQSAIKLSISASLVPLPVADQELVKLVQQVADSITEVVMATLRRKVIVDSLTVPADGRDRKEKSNGKTKNLDRG